MVKPAVSAIYVMNAGGRSGGIWLEAGAWRCVPTASFPYAAQLYDRYWSTAVWADHADHKCVLAFILYPN